MKVVFGFTHVVNHYKPINDNFFRLAKLSVKSAKKFYKTKIYCDNISLNLFKEKGITFDEVIIIDEFILKYTDNYEYNSNQYSISKIYAMMNETEPYILMDFDVILMEKLESTHSITYGQPEEILNGEHITLNQLLWAHDSYINPFNTHMKKYFDDKDISHFNWTTFPSFCVLMVKLPYFVSTIFKEIMDIVPREEIYKIPPTLLEQFIFHQYVLKHNVDFGFFIPHIYKDYSTNFESLDLISQKFLHINTNKKDSRKNIGYLENIV